MHRKVGIAVQLIDGFTMRPLDLPAVVTAEDGRAPVKKQEAVWIFWEGHETYGRIQADSPCFFRQEQEFPEQRKELQRIWMVPNTKYPYPAEYRMTMTEKTGVPGESIVFPLKGTEGNIWLAEDCMINDGLEDEACICLCFTRGLEIWPDILWIEENGKGEAVYLIGNTGCADEKRLSDGAVIRRYQLRKRLSESYRTDSAVCRFVYHTAADEDGRYLIPINF